MVVSKGKPIGLFEEIEIEDRCIFLKDHERLFLFTDGLHETVNGDRKLLDFGGLIDIITMTGDLPLDESLDAVIDMVNDYRGNAPEEDDIILLAFDFPVKNN